MDLKVQDFRENGELYFSEALLMTSRCSSFHSQLLKGQSHNLRLYVSQVLLMLPTVYGTSLEKVTFE